LTIRNNDPNISFTINAANDSDKQQSSSEESDKRWLSSGFQ
jgi:hypothetical protein